MVDEAVGLLVAATECDRTLSHRASHFVRGATLHEWRFIEAD